MQSANAMSTTKTLIILTRKRINMTYLKAQTGYQNKKPHNKPSQSNTIPTTCAHLLLQHGRRLHFLRIRRLRPRLGTLLSLHNLHRVTPPPAFACQIAPHAAKVPRQALSAFPERIHADGEGGAHEPDDADNDPAGEEGLAEDVAGAVEGHGPEDEENNGHGCGCDFCDFRGAQKFGLFGGFGLGGEREVAAHDVFDVELRGVGDFRVVHEADVFHGNPVVVVWCGVSVRIFESRGWLTHAED
jgi:hypothetical protein